jgi:hypothetical protein
VRREGEMIEHEKQGHVTILRGIGGDSSRHGHMAGIEEQLARKKMKGLKKKEGRVRIGLMVYREGNT